MGFYAERVKLEYARIRPEELQVFSDVIQGVSRWFQEHGQPMWPLEMLTAQALLEAYPHGEFWIGRIAEKAVATFVLVEHDPSFWPDVAPHESVFIHKIAVDRRFKGQNLGVHILDFARDQAINRGKRFLRLDTDVRRLPVRAVYERYGFTWAGECRAHDFDCVLYELELR